MTSVRQWVWEHKRYDCWSLWAVWVQNLGEGTVPMLQIPRILWTELSQQLPKDQFGSSPHSLLSYQLTNITGSCWKRDQKPFLQEAAILLSVYFLQQKLSRAAQVWTWVYSLVMRSSHLEGLVWNKKWGAEICWYGIKYRWLVSWLCQCQQVTLHSKVWQKIV